MKIYYNLINNSINNKNIAQSIVKMLSFAILILFFSSNVLLSNSTSIRMLDDDAKDEQETSLPGTIRSMYSAEQDSAFRAALDMNVPFSLRARLDLELSESLWRLAIRAQDVNPWVSAMNALGSLPEGIFTPRDVEIAQWQTNIMNSMYVPFVRTYNPNSAVVDIATVARFLGLVEDVSPIIRYSLYIAADVEIVVYSIQGVVIATLFNGPQSAGNYSINWNGRDEKGRAMPAGDYIAEVRIGEERYVRKRIVLK